MRHTTLLAGALLAALTATPASATLIGGVEFPDGTASFADAVVSYDPVIISGEPTDANRGASNALGTPDYISGGACASQVDCSFASLGSGGSITLAFIDNKLTGSGDATLDLWIFEVGPDIEDTFVEISMNGLDWFDVGKVFGATAGIDIDAFGFGPDDLFGFVRLTDDPNVDATTGASVGADIDAVGAITTVLTPSQVPKPATLGLLGVGLAWLGIRSAVSDPPLSPAKSASGEPTRSVNSVRRPLDLYSCPDATLQRPTHAASCVPRSTSSTMSCRIAVRS